MTETTSRQSELKQGFVEKFGFWDDSWERMLRKMPRFLKAYLDFASAGHDSGHLEPKVRELLLVATSTATTQLYAPAARRHIVNAMKLGASEAEVLEVLQLASVLGIHSCAVGVPILIDEARKRGLADDLDDAIKDPALVELKEDFIAKRGFWTDFWQGVLTLSPAFFTSYLRMSALPWTDGVLDAKTKEFIYIAIDGATTHLHAEGLRVHIQNAFKHGATKEEIMDVLMIISTIGIYSCSFGVELLDDDARCQASG